MSARAGTGEAADTDSEPLVVSFPELDGDHPDQDAEWCEVGEEGERRRIRFHDYDEIYAIPGLYERIFRDHLHCQSPQVVAGLLGEQIRRAGVDPQDLRALDVGAGNGMVGEELHALGMGAIVGIDIIPEAAEGARRDRPDVYEDYLVEDLTDLSDEARERLTDLNCMTTVATLGFDDMPTAAFEGAFELIEPGGWVAFTIKEDFLDHSDETGFRRMITEMLAGGAMEERARRRYQHRLSISGKPLHYVAIVATKRG